MLVVAVTPHMWWWFSRDGVSLSSTQVNTFLADTECLKKVIRRIREPIAGCNNRVLCHGAQSSVPFSKSY